MAEKLKCKNCKNCLQEKKGLMCKVAVRKIMLKQYKGTAIVQPEDECKFGKVV